MAESYLTTFGKKSEVRDKYNGEPRWLETVIQEYETGLLGPMHNCQGYCECISCSRLAWIQNPTCSCPYGSYRLSSFSLDDAMRRKWSNCRCLPPYATTTHASICLCILLVQTQEWLQSPNNTYSLPSNLLQDPRSSVDITNPLTNEEAETLLRIVDHLEAEARRLSAREQSNHKTELLVNEGTTVLLSEGDVIGKTHGERSYSGDEGEMEDTTSSSVK
ncbi:hypothetical protein M758_UG181300 [Ceratodon purpureus]|nr:hypothetical protein M758_UG181300 [Ceratodon purpureus]